MAKRSVSEQIVSIRVAAGGDASRCPTCCRPADAPYRRQDTSGNYIEGCVDAVHGRHMLGATGTSAWHFRPEAVALRKAELAWLRSL